MAYVTWKLVFIYDNNKSIYLNKYPYTGSIVFLFLNMVDWKYSSSLFFRGFFP